MKLFLFALSIFAASISIVFYTPLSELVHSLSVHFKLHTPTSTTTTTTIPSQISITASTIASSESSMTARNTVKAMSKALSHAKIVPRRSNERGHSDHGWLNTYHTFSFADYWDRNFQQFGSLRVLNEDRVAPGTGFPTHPHQNAEIFSYILSGELTHRDSMIKKGSEGEQGDDFFRMKRGDVQFTTGGKGIAHSEFNEGDDEQVHFLQIWALPWARGLAPRYHTQTFSEDAKRASFIPIITPLKAGPGASAEEEKVGEAALPDTIPIHADLVMSAGIIGVDKRFKYTVGRSDDGEVVRNKENRKVYIHVPMTKKGAAKIRIDGRESAVLGEGDGAFVSAVNAGDVLSFESIGEAEAEVVILDSN